MRDRQSVQLDLQKSTGLFDQFGAGQILLPVDQNLDPFGGDLPGVPANAARCLPGVDREGGLQLHVEPASILCEQERHQPSETVGQIGAAPRASVQPCRNTESSEPISAPSRNARGNSAVSQEDRRCATAPTLPCRPDRARRSRRGRGRRPIAHRQTGPPRPRGEFQAQQQGRTPDRLGRSGLASEAADEIERLLRSEVKVEDRGVRSPRP